MFVGPHAKFRVEPTPFDRVTSTQAARSRPDIPGPGPVKSRPRKRDFFAGNPFIYVPGDSRKVSSETDSVWASYEKL